MESCPEDAARLRRILLCLAGISAVCLLVGLNRKFPPAFLRTPLFDVMQVTDVLFMLLFTPVSLFLGWLMLKAYGGTGRMLNVLLFLAGVYLLGLGFGMHDPFNALHMYRGGDLSPAMLRSVAYFDDVLGHRLFFAGFMLASLSVVAAEAVRPFRVPIPWPWMSLPVAMGVVSGVVVWHNMVNEKTGGDLVALLATVAATAAVQAACRTGSPRHAPVSAVLYLAYGGGALATLLAWCR